MHTKTTIEFNRAKALELILSQRATKVRGSAIKLLTVLAEHIEETNHSRLVFSTAHTVESYSLTPLEVKKGKAYLVKLGLIKCMENPEWGCPIYQVSLDFIVSHEEVVKASLEDATRVIDLYYAFMDSRAWDETAWYDFYALKASLYRQGIKRVTFKKLYPLVREAIVN